MCLTVSKGRVSRGKREGTMAAAAGELGDASICVGSTALHCTALQRGTGSARQEARSSSGPPILSPNRLAFICMICSANALHCGQITSDRRCPGDGEYVACIYMDGREDANMILGLGPGQSGVVARMSENTQMMSMKEHCSLLGQRNHLWTLYLLSRSPNGSGPACGWVSLGEREIKESLRCLSGPINRNVTAPREHRRKGGLSWGQPRACCTRCAVPGEPSCFRRGRGHR